MSDLKLRIATRKSALALAQTTMAADAIVAANSVIGNAADSNNARDSLTYELVSMTTEGDRRLDKSLASFGGKGVFIKELEIALLEGHADIAIHSLKDMPAEVLPQFKLAAVLKRADPRDAFLSRGGAPLYGFACRCSRGNGKYSPCGTAESAPPGFGICADSRKHPDSHWQTCGT